MGSTQVNPASPLYQRINNLVVSLDTQTNTISHIVGLTTSHTKWRACFLVWCCGSHIMVGHNRPWGIMLVREKLQIYYQMMKKMFRKGTLFHNILLTSVCDNLDYYVVYQNIFVLLRKLYIQSVKKMS